AAQPQAAQLRRSRVPVARARPGAARQAADGAREPAPRHETYGCFGVWYSASFWNGSQMVSKPTKPFSFGGNARVVTKRECPSGTGALGDCWCSLMFHLLLPWSQGGTREARARGPSCTVRCRCSDRPKQPWVDVRAGGDRPATLDLVAGCVAHGQNLEREDDLPAAKRVVAIDSQG